MIGQWYHVTWWRKYSAETLKKVFSNEKKGFKKDLSALTPREFFHVYIINKRLVQFQLFEKLTHRNKFQIELVWLPIQIHHVYFSLILIFSARFFCIAFSVLLFSIHVFYSCYVSYFSHARKQLLHKTVVY